MKQYFPPLRRLKLVITYVFLSMYAAFQNLQFHLHRTAIFLISRKAKTISNEYRNFHFFSPSSCIRSSIFNLNSNEIFVLALHITVYICSLLSSAKWILWIFHFRCCSFVIAAPHSCHCYWCVLFLLNFNLKLYINLHTHTAKHSIARHNTANTK